MGSCDYNDGACLETISYAISLMPAPIIFQPKLHKYISKIGCDPIAK